MIDLDPGDDYDDGDIGFAPGDDPLPQTGIDADRIGLAALMFLIGGLALLLIGKELEYRRRRDHSTVGRLDGLVGDVAQVGDIGERGQRQDVGPRQGGRFDPADRSVR